MLTSHLKYLVLVVLLQTSITCWATDNPTPAQKNETRQYTFSWQFADASRLSPRGGTTQGPEVTLSTLPTSAWQQLQEPGLSKREKDRRAILAMAGPYRTSFDFIETVGFVLDYEAQAPYQSWATEYVYVVADKPELVSLQHILVMTILDKNNKPFEPIVVKHWRQDWHYEASTLNTYNGNNTWQREERSLTSVKGLWRQAVYQVDDSPRYQAIGEWQHYGNYSSWQSEETWRPLPRREFSVRDDYDVLIGTNRHTIYPTGWVQEEENLKVVLDTSATGNIAKSILAREVGLARYERIDGHDWSAGDTYWAQTAPFWALVRDTWEEILEQESPLSVAKTVKQEPLFAIMFKLANSTTKTLPFNKADVRQLIQAELAKFTN